MMSKIRFPATYFGAIFSPTRIFTWRTQLNWVQQFFVYLFLTAILMLPISIEMAAQETVAFDKFMPNVKHMLTTENALKFNQLTMIDGRLSEETPQIFAQDETAIIGVALSSDEVAAADYAIDFRSQSWRVKETIEDKTYEYTMSYSAAFNPSKAVDAAAFEQMISQEFFHSNQWALFLSRNVTAFFLLFTMNSLLVLGAAFFLWLTRKSEFSMIKTYKESTNIILNSMGVGAICGMIAGFFSPDITLIIGVQSMLLVLMLFLAYLKTHFQVKQLTEKTE